MLESPPVGDAFWPEDWRALPPAEKPRQQEVYEAPRRALLPYVQQQREVRALIQPKAAAFLQEVGFSQMSGQKQSQVLPEQQQYQQLVTDQMGETGRGDL